MPGGRPPHYETAELLQIDIDKYIDYCKSENEWPNKLGFCVWAGVYKNMLDEYGKKQEFSGTLSKLDELSQNTLLQKGLKNEYNAQIVKLIASANYGMTEKNAVEHSGSEGGPIQIALNKHLENA